MDYEHSWKLLKGIVLDSLIEVESKTVECEIESNTKIGIKIALQQIFDLILKEETNSKT